MTDNSTAQDCNRARLDAYLAGDLSQAEMCSVEDHLSTCPTCSSRLETEAATEETWRQTRDLLSTDIFDGPMSLSSATSMLDDGIDELSLDESDVRHRDASMLMREIQGWLDPTDDPCMLGRFAGYEIVGIVGHGGMGIVLKGFESALNRFVAIKVLAPRLATSEAARKRFAREAQAAAAVIHENVIAIHRVDQAHGLPFLVMPYLGGVSLQQRIDREGPLSIEACLRIGSQIAAALSAAHTQGLVHRDIKPANILLERGVERVTITDFGLARAADDASVTRTGMIAGTPQYMSPEQARAQRLDARSDLFSLGSVLYVMATGKPPFNGEASFEILDQIINGSAPSIRDQRDEIPEWYESLVARLHQKSPDDRPASATELKEWIDACLQHLQAADRPLPANLSGDRRKRNRRWPLPSAIVLLVAAVSFVARLERQGNTSTDATDPTNMSDSAGEVGASSASSVVVSDVSADDPQPSTNTDMDAPPPEAAMTDLEFDIEIELVETEIMELEQELAE